MRELADVLNYFLTTRAQLLGRARIADTPDHRAIFKDIPAIFTSELARQGKQHIYKVEGSIGNGNIARVPWVGIFNRAITESAQNGYYIVLLFAEDMGACYLSLNQGVTAMEKLYTPTLARAKMREAAKKAYSLLPSHQDARYGEILLRSTGDLGKGYECAAIESFRYERTNLPAESQLLVDFRLLLEHYELLVQKFGKDLQQLVSITEGEFQRVVLEKASASEDVPYIETDGPVDIPPLAGFASRGHLRSPKIAAQAIRNSNFKCEIDPSHWTFLSRRRRQPYVEAHHLVPMSQQAGFSYSLDVPANIVALCATCHRLLHYGHHVERRALLRQLYTARRHALEKKAIVVRETEFFRYYGQEHELED